MAATSDTPYALEVNDGDAAAANEPAAIVLAGEEEEEAGFYINKDWFFAKKKFGVYSPQKEHKPQFLNDLDDGLWDAFDREAHHYQKYYTMNSWFYTLWTIGYPLLFVFLIVPDNHWLMPALALAIVAKFFFQRRLFGNKIQPMYRQFVSTYKSSFRKNGFSIDYELEPIAMGGTNSYIVFRKTACADQTVTMGDEPTEYGWYLDETALGSMPFALEVASPMHLPYFLQGVDEEKWRAFTKDLGERSKTLITYLLPYAIGIGLLGAFCIVASIYGLMMLTGLPLNWLMLALISLVFLLEVGRAVQRQHFLEKVLVQNMKDLLKEYEPMFDAAGIAASFEMEYHFSRCCLNSYLKFWKTSPGYQETTLATP
jgi:hypothetical protein